MYTGAHEPPSAAHVLLMFTMSHNVTVCSTFRNNWPCLYRRHSITTTLPWVMSQCAGEGTILAEYPSLQVTPSIESIHPSIPPSSLPLSLTLSLPHSLPSLHSCLPPPSLPPPSLTPSLPPSPISLSPAALHYNIPLWYSSPHGTFEIIGEHHSHLTTSRKAKSMKMSTISVSCRDWDYSHRPAQECLRLNFGVTLPPQELSPSTPCLHPRPGPLSPSPTSEQDIIHMFSEDFFTPKKVMVSYSVVVPAGQDPSLVFIGWTTSGFRYIQSQFHSGTHLNSDSSLSPLKYGQHVDMVTQRRLSTTSFSTAFLICLSELLTNPQQHISVAVTYVCKYLPQDVTMITNTVECH